MMVSQSDEGSGLLRPEFESLLTFLADNPETDLWEKLVPQASEKNISHERISGNLESYLVSGEGNPVVIPDALRSTEMEHMKLDMLRSRFGDTQVLANDRAPARHADANEGLGGKQRTLKISLDAFISTYVEGNPSSLEGHLSPGAQRPTQPFYVNGWRPPEVSTELAEAMRAPDCLSHIDNTREIAAALNETLFGEEDPTTSSHIPWWDAVDHSLTKIFLGPPGTITRLHFDAGRAHGWLAQISGRKLFILYPPSSTALVHQLDGEPETSQSPVDPLSPDLERWPHYARTSPQAVILRPGEALLIPQGWWHYAVALDTSITLQRNFYNIATNARGLVELVLKTIKGLKASPTQ